MEKRISNLEDLIRTLSNKVDSVSQMNKLQIIEAVNESDQTKSIHTILYLLIFIATIVVILGVAQILLLWGLAE